MSKDCNATEAPFSGNHQPAQLEEQLRAITARVHALEQAALIDKTSLTESLGKSDSTTRFTNNNPSFLGRDFSFNTSTGSTTLDLGNNTASLPTNQYATFSSNHASGFEVDNFDPAVLLPQPDHPHINSYSQWGPHPNSMPDPTLNFAVGSRMGYNSNSTFDSMLNVGTGSMVGHNFNSMSDPTSAFSMTLPDVVPWNNMPNFVIPSLLQQAAPQENGTAPSNAPVRRRFQCTQCTKSYLRRGDRDRHARIHDPNAVRFPCPAHGCNRSGNMAFFRQDKLAEHRFKKNH